MRGIITARSARDQKPLKAKYKDRQRAGLYAALGGFSSRERVFSEKMAGTHRGPSVIPLAA